jgi:hypothetical protein
LPASPITPDAGKLPIATSLPPVGLALRRPMSRKVATQKRPIFFNPTHRIILYRFGD